MAVTSAFARGYHGIMNDDGLSCMISQERDDWQNTYGSSGVCPKFGEKELLDGSDSPSRCVVDVS